MWAGGQIPSPGNPQAEPMIGKAINGGFDLLEARHNRCDRVSILPLLALATGAASLEDGSLAVPRVLQRRPALQPAAAGAYSGLSNARPDPTQPAHKIAFDPDDFLVGFGTGKLTIHIRKNQVVFSQGHLPGRAFYASIFVARVV